LIGGKGPVAVKKGEQKEQVMRFLPGLLAMGLWVATMSGPAIASDRPLVVVELFTSQGCASCPPADAFLARLAKRDDVLALSMHVDYWDYIGWPDTFARPEHTARQKAYAHVAGTRSIFTPQMIIAGKDYVVGSKPMDVADYIEMSREMPARVQMDAVLVDGVLRFDASPATHMPLPDSLLVMFVTFEENATVMIQRGENAGKTIEYSNIVTSLTELGTWDGVGAFSLEVPVTARGAKAVFLQEAGPGEILGAVRVR